MKQPSLSNRIVPAFLLADGSLCVLIAVFAHEIGMDPDTAWGRFRYILLFCGALLLLSSLLFRHPKKWNLAFVDSLGQSEGIKTLFLLGHIWALVFVVYAWFITFGNFTTWRNTTRYYTQLADAFSKGQLHVDAQPGAALLAAEDPYDPTGRPPFDTNIWDMSLYKGRLYLYWGPVPALLILPIQFVTKTAITDIYPVYFFFCGLLIFNSLVILKLWRMFFADVPARNVAASIFLIGLILPILWCLNKPEVYQAAIGAGQFFLIGGIYFAISAFGQNGTVSKRDLFLAGLFWVCSVGSRAMNVLPLFFIVPFILVWMFKTTPKPIPRPKYVQTAAALLLPLIAGGAALGWYNWARFDSPFEFGLRYQITIHNLNQIMPLTFQADYFLPNLYAYVFQPFEFVEKFPFIQPATSAGFFEKFNITPPKIYYSGRMVGLLIHAPFLILAFLPLFSKTETTEEGIHRNPPRKFVIVLLVASFLINFLSLLFFFFGVLRYSVDVISQITLLAILGYWEIVRRKQRRNSARSKVFLHAANLLVAATLLAGFLLAFSSETNRIEKMNPALMEKLDSFFMPRE
jgi:hypothetical protein